MILAKFFRGPLDMELIPLPTEEPWPRFAIPERNRLSIRYFYLYAGARPDIAPEMLDVGTSTFLYYYLFNDELTLS